MSKIVVEVAYATAMKQYVKALQVDPNTTIELAILQSGITKVFPEINLEQQKVGIFGKIRELLDTVKEGDRIEIYRPLINDPKETRRARAKKNK